MWENLTDDSSTQWICFQKNKGGTSNVYPQYVFVATIITLSIGTDRPLQTV